MYMGKCQTTGHVLPRSFDLTPPHHLPTIHVSPKMSWCHFPPHSFWIQGYRTVQTAKCALERNKLKLDFLRLCQRGASVKSENQFRPSTLIQLNTAFIGAKEHMSQSSDLCLIESSCTSTLKLQSRQVVSEILGSPADASYQQRQGLTRWQQ